MTQGQAHWRRERVVLGWILKRYELGPPQQGSYWKISHPDEDGGISQGLGETARKTSRPQACLCLLYTASCSEPGWYGYY